MSISDSLSYFYIKKIKRWMHCPICNNKMFFNTNSSNWICDGCKYSLSETEFLDDYIFWFCDCCNTYLNIQSGFDRKVTQHVCEICGFDNNTTPSNIVGICKDCGKHIDNPNTTICEDCKIVRLEKVQKKLNKLSKTCEQLKNIID